MLCGNASAAFARTIVSTRTEWGEQQTGGGSTLMNFTAGNNRGSFREVSLRCSVKRSRGNPAGSTMTVDFSAFESEDDGCELLAELLELREISATFLGRSPVAAEPWVEGEYLDHLELGHLEPGPYELYPSDAARWANEACHRLDDEVCDRVIAAAGMVC